MAQLGTTFSQIQCEYLNLDYRETLQSVLTIKFNYIRVCAYWSEIEPHEGHYNFSKLDTIINTISNTNTQIILAIGMKSPRWPEFHFPEWIKKKYNTNLAHVPIDTQADLSQCAFNFIQKVLERYKKNAKISHIQIENEAFNNFPFTGNKFVSRAFVKRAVAQTRVISPEKKILLSNAINLAPFDWNFSYNNAFNKNTALADTIGVNVYTKVPVSPDHYIEPTFLYWWKLSKWQKKMQHEGIEPWITEAQAEPWEYQSAVHTQKAEYPSASPQRTEALVKKLAELNFQTILLWGCEYWYWSKLQGNEQWWSSIIALREYCNDTCRCGFR